MLLGYTDIKKLYIPMQTLEQTIRYDVSDVLEVSGQVLIRCIRDTYVMVAEVMIQ